MYCEYEPISLNDVYKHSHSANNLHFESVLLSQCHITINNHLLKCSEIQPAIYIYTRNTL